MSEPAAAGPAGAAAPHLRVLLVDDAMIVRAGVTQLLAREGVQVVAAAADAGQVLPMVRRHTPDVLVTDLRMPPDYGIEGLTLCAAVRAELPATGLLLLSSFLEVEVAAQLLRLGPGVGYLLKERISAGRELVATLRGLAAGAVTVDSEITELLLSRPHTRRSLADLSDREREVLALVARGASNAAIATELFLTVKTVESHVRTILRKLALPEETAYNRRVLAVLTYLREAT